MHEVSRLKDYVLDSLSTDRFFYERLNVHGGLRTHS